MHWSIKTKDSDDLPIRLHVEADTQEAAIAAIREKGYFPESVTEIKPESKKKPKSTGTIFGIIGLQIIIVIYFVSQAILSIR